jgi:hypothetical protein
VTNLYCGFLVSFDKLLLPQLALFRDMRFVVSLQDYIFLEVARDERKKETLNHVAHWRRGPDNKVLLPTLVLDEGDPAFVSQPLFVPLSVSMVAIQLK